jgi:hypothetical protein
MIFDKQTMFSDAQAVTATAASTNAIDLGPIASGIARDIGKGTPVPLLVQVVEDFTLLTSLKIDLEFDSTDTFTPDKTITLGTYLLADLKAGMQVPYQFIPDGANMRYMRLKYTVTGTSPDAGKITAGIVMGRQTNG